MDVCTLVTLNALAIACIPRKTCEEANGKQYCVMTPGQCPAPEPYFDCMRSDGTSYQAPVSEHPMLAPLNSLGTSTYAR